MGFWYRCGKPVVAASSRRHESSMGHECPLGTFYIWATLTMHRSLCILHFWPTCSIFHLDMIAQNTTRDLVLVAPWWVLALTYSVCYMHKSWSYVKPIYIFLISVSGKQSVLQPSRKSLFSQTHVLLWFCEYLSDDHRALLFGSQLQYVPFCIMLLPALIKNKH